MRPRAYTAMPVVVVAALAAAACDRRPPATPSSEPAQEWFSERAGEAGLAFTHFNGMSGRLFMSEILAPGVALLDIDNDGDLDVFVPQGQMLGKGLTLNDALAPPRMPLPLKGHLYRNDGPNPLHFTDITDASGIVTTGYGMGVATGDFDNDGFVDLYVTGVGASQLFHNNGNGTFTDVTKSSGAGVDGWTVAATFFDYDRDGWLDLYVGSYLQYSPDASTKCFSPSGALDYCTPNTYKPLPGRLFHNNRNGTFTDVTAESRIASEFGPALGVTAADFNGDGWIDLYVANDSQPNQLWINRQDGTFTNTAFGAGVALTAEGKAEASMGVDAGDFDNDGDEDIVVTEQTGEGHNLYVNDGHGTFEDQSARSGLGSASLGFTGFGAAWFDYDNDGWLDLLTVNGAVQTIQALAQAHDPFPLHQRKQLFRNLGNRRFEEVGAKAGKVFALSEVGRGAAFGDIDNDGDTDVVVANNSGPVRVLINNIGNRKHWIGLRLVGQPVSPRRGTRGRDMLGARVEIIRKNPPTLWRRVRADGSYASANDPRVLVGLGDSTEVPSVRVHWPDGRTSVWSDLTLDRYTTLAEPAR
jgi:enediyne biosynthesis protein E4